MSNRIVWRIVWTDPNARAGVSRFLTRVSLMKGPGMRPAFGPRRDAATFGSEASADAAILHMKLHDCYPVAWRE
jgi:hypothetical protein